MGQRLPHLSPRRERFAIRALHLRYPLTPRMIWQMGSTRCRIAWSAVFATRLEADRRKGA